MILCHWVCIHIIVFLCYYVLGNQCGKYESKVRRVRTVRCSTVLFHRLSNMSLLPVDWRIEAPLFLVHLSIDNSKLFDISKSSSFESELYLTILTGHHHNLRSWLSMARHLIGMSDTRSKSMSPSHQLTGSVPFLSYYSIISLTMQL